MKKVLICAVLSFLISLNGRSQTKTIEISKISSSIELDGIPNEAFWSLLPSAKSFTEHFPSDSGLAKIKTEVKITFDDQNLYLAAWCYTDTPERQTIQSLRRDFNPVGINDAFGVVLDPFKDHTNGFIFAVTPAGTQSEGILENGASHRFSVSWNNKWKANSVKTATGWTTEMAIPFKSLRYNPKVKTWGINFFRNDQTAGEKSTWKRVPVNLKMSSLPDAGNLIWKDAPPVSKGNASIIPYVSYSFEHDIEEGEPSETNFGIGTDAKVAISSSLNLDLTINPDFAQVEVDRQVTNLSQFSLYFPEKRNFFLENSDLFANFGFRQIRPFFSRQIGIHNGESVPILAGARLSGKPNKNWRIGLLNMQTAKQENLNLSPYNYTTATFQRNIIGRSTLSGIFVNKQATSGDSTDFNRVIGFDYNIFTKSNKVQGKLFYHRSFSPENKPNSHTHASWLMYRTRKITAMWNHEYVDKNYLAKTGFVPRIQINDPATDSTHLRSYWRFEPLINYRIYPSSGKVNNFEYTLYFSQYYDVDWKNTGRVAETRFKISFNNTSSLFARFGNEIRTLFFDRDVTFTDQKAIPFGNYANWQGNIRYNSNRRKNFSYNVGALLSEYYLGKRTVLFGGIDYRIQPWGTFSLNFSQNRIDLPEPYSDVNLTLVGTKVDLSFSKTMFLSTFFQYNTQAENFNLNTRFQWRFRPMSDIYLVYTDNYDAERFGPKNKALILKIVYWLSV